MAAILVVITASLVLLYCLLMSHRDRALNHNDMTKIIQATAITHITLQEMIFVLSTENNRTGTEDVREKLEKIRLALERQRQHLQQVFDESQGSGD